MDNALMKCSTCGTERASRYAAYCHVCGSPLPELPPTPEDEALANQHGDPTGHDGGFVPPVSNQAPPTYPQQQVYTATPPPGAGQQPPASRPPAARGGASQPPPPPPEGGEGAVRVYDRPDVPPSQVRRKRLMIVIGAIGVLVSLLLLLAGPLRGVLSARDEPAWTPPGTETPAGGMGITGTVTGTIDGTAVAGLPPGMSAAQATDRARRGTDTPAPTWTPGVDLGGAAGTVAAPGALPTLAPAPTTTPPATATLPPTLTLPPPTNTQPPPTATQPPPTATIAPTVAPPPTAVAQPTAAAGTGASLPAALSGGRALAFVSDRSGSPQVWVMDASGSNQLQVTQAGRNTSPSWSLDNRFLYYIGERGGDTSVYRLDITNGSEERLVSNPDIVAARPMPNGQLSLVVMEEGRYTLYAGDRRLYQLDRAFQFQFSPDGRRVLIDPNAPPRVIIVVDVATTQAVEVAPANSWNAGWGPGSRLAYVSDRTGIASVYISGPNGEEARFISPGDKWSQAPAFSSDGSAVAFIGGDGPAWNVYVVGSVGGEARRVGGPANPGKSPAWQPTGALIAYESDRAGHWDIYVTDPQGNERNLTNAPSNDVDPAWTW
jgi:Tol biopolymer transport system component